MTWTSAVGRTCKVILHKIVHGLALTKINPNYLTFLGLVINLGAGVLFGYASGDNQGRLFRYAALVIIGAGIFDMVDGRVARATGQVTDFGGFFDSVIDRYSDVALYFGLLVYYARANRFFYVVLTAIVMVTSVMISYTRARAETLIPSAPLIAATTSSKRRSSAMPDQTTAIWILAGSFTMGMKVSRSTGLPRSHSDS